MLEKRSERSKVSRGVAGWVSAGTGIGSTSGMLLANPSYNKGVAIIAAATVASAAIGAATAFKINSRAVKEATHFVGKALGDVAKNDDVLKRFLGEWRYVRLIKTAI